MKRTIGLALATGLALLVAGCGAGQMGSQPPSGPGDTSSGATRTSTSAPAATRNFNLAVKCPGVHWEKVHKWSDSQIMEQESIDASDIPACEQWVAAQPKGYVPPAPGGATASAKPAPEAGGAPAPTKQ